MNDDMKSLSTLCMLRVMVSMAIADNTIDDREIDKICEIYQNVTGRPIDPADVQSIARIMRFDRIDTLKVVRDSARHLDDDTKDDIVRAAHMVLIADGDVTAVEYTRLNDIASSLNMPGERLSVLLRGLGA